ncbi:MAG: glutamate racemase, partial [Clostridia bacterium]
VQLISSGREAAGYTKKILEREGLLSDRAEEGRCEFFVSDSTESFAALGGVFLGKAIELNVHRTKI